MGDADWEWTQEEVAALAATKPEFVADVNGRKVPTMDKADILALAARYPSMRLNKAVPSAEARANAAAQDAERDAALRARYPSMFKP
ncbi:hypothetical protein [Anaeromyxobacter dehalogenans]|uniref:Uncharacterized protein n=1 Tax=Anaeromyxobacter dehalogenans (strain 2CP-C) TaxID=290397 RepID=Q2IKC8_ANADE|nr:hypothetical protein [Anaeromyxobacter dehalogenans]ABC82105.1 hypothetical protein Adeh_2335 [Anaeromyxobacter dehalogenans 2CP-C]